jgi:hypothetical protein
VHHVGLEAGLHEQFGAAPGLGLAGLAQVDVHPTGEQIGQVPFALAVAE